MTGDIKDPFDLLEDEINKEMETIYSRKTIEYAKNPLNVGRMNDPDGAAAVKGLCGDSMEIYLVIKDKIILDAKFFTDGCGVTYACGSAVTELVKGKTIDTVLTLSPKSIIDFLGGLTEENIHCSLLAINTLFKAVAEYLLKK
ncbi:MAG: iron-sulfur cluster assembly scaffold protein [Spirochaetales bacterium]|nr:iron-sulfur cluster assembly scaffold protein [Spirochaetales bacterium]